MNAVLGGIDSIEHGIFMDEECCREMIARGTYLVPTLSAIRNILANAAAGVPDYVVAKAKMVEASHARAFRMFYEAGGRIAMGTDAGTPFNRHGANAMELAFMAELGMTPADALKSATAVAADLNRLDAQGRLSEGRLADLLLVDGDPTEDIAMAADKANHRLVVKAGRVAKRRSNTD